jgi:hypothetical protein
VRVVGSTSTYYAGTSTTILGFHAPGWLAAIGLAMVPVTLFLVGSTGPWRPRPGAYRLTGGWAFLLASAVGAALR